ncbi:MAG TPA: 2-oxoacid:acceptor oxidoreductase subunit alpha [Dehalococcoidia bacterium]|nr:2-oxoacid:acceptor oxidoreductase subunit alpha [Dehalococcoidia bacterium]
MAWKEVRSSLPPGSYYYSGNEAAAEGAIAAGCRYYGGYPITPSSEIMEWIAVRFGEVGGVFIQMEDEIASLSSVIGASWAGAKAMTATSGPGFSLMQEGIGYAAMTETPVVIVDIQRAGPATGQATRVGGGDIMQARWGSQGDYPVIAISPWSVQEMYDQTINAFNLAERYRVPVILLGEQAVGHLRERMDVREKIAIFNRRKEKGAAPFGAGDDGVPPMPAFGEGEKLLVTGSSHDDYGWRKVADPLVQAKLTARLHDKIANNRDEIIQYEDYYAEDADVMVIAYGFTARSSLFAVERIRRGEKKVGMIRLKTIWPFADSLIRDVGSRVKKIFVPEMNRGQIAGEVMKYTCCDIIPYNQTDGEIIHPNTIMGELRRLL